MSSLVHNQRIVNDVDKLEGLLELQEIKKRELQSLQVFLRDLSERIDAAAKTDLIYGNVAISEFDDHFYPVSSEIERYAEVYKNANNPRLWGLNLRTFPRDAHSMNGGKFMGTGWKRKKDAVKAALNWIAYGKEPQWNGGAK